MTSVPDPQAVNSTLLTNRFQFPHLTTQTSSSIMSLGLHLKSKKTLTLIQGKGQGNWKRQRCTMNLTSYGVVIDSLCGQQSTHSWLRDWKCWSQCSAEKREYIVEPTQSPSHLAHTGYCSKIYTCTALPFRIYPANCGSKGTRFSPPGESRPLVKQRQDSRAKAQDTECHYEKGIAKTR